MESKKPDVAEPTPPSTGPQPLPKEGCIHCRPDRVCTYHAAENNPPVSGEGTGTPPTDRRTQGLYGKFVVHRTDGRDAAGQKHDGCTYFVLDLQHDPHMPAALRAYAKSCEKDYPTLARQLRIVADDFGKRGEFVGIMAQKPALDLERQKAGEGTWTLTRYSTREIVMDASADKRLGHNPSWIKAADVDAVRDAEAAENFRKGWEAGKADALADLRRQGEWQPIATLPADLHDTPLDFWIVPKTPEEAYVNTSGDPIFGTFPPYRLTGKFKTWSSLSKATHWRPLPDPPAQS